MPIGGRNRKRESSPTKERPAKRQRTNDDLRNNILAAYATTTSPHKSRRSFVNPVAELGNGSAEPQGIAGGEQSVHIEEALSVSQSIGIVTSNNKRTYGGKSRTRAVRQVAANGALTAFSNVDDSTDPDAEEGMEEKVESAFFTKGTSRQNPRGDSNAGETHEGVRSEAMVDISHSRVSPIDRHSTKSAKSASPQSPLTRGCDSDTAAAREPEDPPIHPINDSSKDNRLSISPTLLVLDRRVSTSAQSNPSDGVDEGSTRSVEVPVSHLPKVRRGRPRKSKAVPKVPQPITQDHQRGSIGANGKGAKVKLSPSPKRALKSLPSTPSPLPSTQSKRQTFDCVLLPSPRKSGSKLFKTREVTEGVIFSRSRTTSPIPNAASSPVARTLRPGPRLLSQGESIEGKNIGQGQSKRVKKGKGPKGKPLISRSEREDECDPEPEVLSARGRSSASTRNGKEAAQVIRRGRGWIIMEEDITSDEEPTRSSKAGWAPARTSRSQGRHSPDVCSPTKTRSKQRSAVKQKQTKKTPTIKSAPLVLSSPSNTSPSTNQSRATTDVGSESEIDPGAETDTTSYSLKFSDPLVAHSPRSTISSIAVPVPSDFETDTEEPQEFIPAIRQSSTFTHSVISGATTDDPEMELDEPDIRPVMSPNKVLRGSLPHHLYDFVPIQKRAVLQRIRNPPYVELGGDKAMSGAGRELQGLLEGTMERGEGNSCLVLGPRGSGKSLLVETILGEIVKRAIVIRLSGHAQATDRHAMREIAYQLNHQTGSSFNIPEDSAENTAPDEEENDHQYNFAPPAAYLPTLISQLPTLSRPVIVVLDAFDLFAQHPRQALLYCLLDTVQSCRAGAGRNGLLVVGMTTKVNCVNLLEKRVKSRFSQRVLRVPSLAGVDDVLQFVKTVLSPGLERLEPEEAMQEWNQIWTDNVQRFLAHSDVRATLQESCGLRSDPGHILQLLIPVILDFDIEHPRLSSSSLVSSAEGQRPSRFEFISYLPQTAMWLLVATYKWETAGHPIFNFSMLWKAFKMAAAEAESAHLVVSVPGTVRSIKTTSVLPETLQGIFEQLVEIRVFQPVLGTGASVTGVGREFVKYRCTIPREEVRRLVEKHGSMDVKSWFASATVLKQ